MLEIKSLVCGHDGTPILTTLDACFEPSSLLFLVGPNGAGKSTLLSTLSGSLSPIAGQVLLPEIPRIGPRAAYLPAAPEIHPALTGRDLLDLFHSSHSPWHSSGLLESLAVENLLDRPVGRLSSGERRRVLLAAVLSHPSSVVLMDEPLNFLDLSSALKLVSLLQGQKSLGRTFVIAVHDLNWALRFSDAGAWALGNGHLVTAGKIRDVVASKEFQTLFDVGTQVLENPLDGSSLLALALTKKT